MKIKILFALVLIGVLLLCGCTNLTPEEKEKNKFPETLEFCKIIYHQNIPVLGQTVQLVHCEINGKLVECLYMTRGYNGGLSCNWDGET